MNLLIARYTGLSEEELLRIKVKCAYTQGVNLGWELLPFQDVKGVRYLKYRCTDLAEPVEFLAAHFCYG